MNNLTFLSLIAILFAKMALGATTSASLPIVDLGYAIHQATNSAYSYYNFSNIRFGASPTGDLRFAHPIPPNTINRTINDGQQTQNCLQAYPGWLVKEEELANNITLPQIANQTFSPKPSLSSVFPIDPQHSEDCLFLDVLVPQKVFESPCGNESRKNFHSGIVSRSNRGAAVLVQIFGGSFDFGTKTLDGDPAGLIARSLENDGEGIIYVAISYRVGLFGWLPGVEEGIGPNAGLYDQRLALQWVQKHIHLFGGNPNRVTVFGKSAGGGSLIHQITAFGGSQKAPFQQAICSSPGFIPHTTKSEQLSLLKRTLDAASVFTGTNITTAAQLRNLSSTQLYLINYAIVSNAAYGDWVYGPSIDDHFVPDVPSTLLSEGKFASDIKVMTAYNLNDGEVFASPFLQNASDFETYLSSFLPAFNSSTIAEVAALYPPTTNLTGYTTQMDRISSFYSEYIFTCNTHFLSRAFRNQTYDYQFNVYRGWHEDDLPYIFFDGDTSTLDGGVAPVNAIVAETLQRYLVNFVMRGSPNGEGLPEFPLYGEKALMSNIDTVGLGTLVKDRVNFERCAWWQQVLSDSVKGLGGG